MFPKQFPKLVQVFQNIETITNICADNLLLVKNKTAANIQILTYRKEQKKKHERCKTPISQSSKAI